MLLNYQWVMEIKSWKIKKIQRDKFRWKHNIPKSSSQFPRRVVLKNVLTMGQLHLSPKLLKVMLKILHTRLQHYVNKELPDGQAELRKGRGTRDQNANICWIIQKARELKKKKSTSVSLTMPKPLTVWIIINCGKLLKRWKYQTILPVSWETCMQVKKQQLEPCMGQLTGPRLRKEYDRAGCCHPVCLIYMLSTSWNIPRWMSYKLESR